MSQPKTRKPKPLALDGVFLPSGLKAALESYLEARPCGEWHQVDDQGQKVEAWRLLTSLRQLVRPDTPVT